MQRRRVKTTIKQRPRGSESRRCDACGHAVSAGDKFCTGCGMPLAGVASAAAPQKQRPKIKTKTKPAAPRMKRKPKTVPPRMKRKPKTITVPTAASQAQKQKTMVVPAMSEQEQKQYVENVPDLFYCSVCNKPNPHGRHVKCPNCGCKWTFCVHKDGKYYRPKDCYNYQTWVDSVKG